LHEFGKLLTLRGSRSQALFSFKPIFIYIQEFRPLIRKLVLMENGIYRTGIYAGSTVNALIRFNVELLFTFIDAIDGTGIDTGFILNTDTRLCNHISHSTIPPRATYLGYLDIFIA